MKSNVFLDPRRLGAVLLSLAILSLGCGAVAIQRWSGRATTTIARGKTANWSDAPE